MLPLPVQFLISLVVSAFNERMARRFEYLHEENRVLREVFTEVTGRKQIPFSDDQRRRLAVKGKALSPAGIEPETERSRQKTWKQLLESHWETLSACDFFTVETLGAFGAVRSMVFFVIELKTRKVHIAGVRGAPDGAWMKQVARNLLDCEDGFLRNATHLILDRLVCSNGGSCAMDSSSPHRSIPGRPTCPC